MNHDGLSRSAAFWLAAVGAGAADAARAVRAFGDALRRSEALERDARRRHRALVPRLVRRYYPAVFLRSCAALDARRRRRSTDPTPKGDPRYGNR